MTVAVTDAISALEDRPVETFRPLHDVIDNDLDELFAFDHADQEPGQFRRFTFE